MGLVKYVWGTERPNVRKRRVEIANRIAAEIEAKAEEIKRRMLAEAAEIRRRGELEKKQVDFLTSGGRYDRTRESELVSKGLAFDPPAKRGRGRPRKHFVPLPSSPSEAAAVRTRGARKPAGRKGAEASRSPARQPVQRPAATPQLGGALLGATSLAQPKARKARSWHCPLDLSDLLNPPEVLGAVFPYVGLPTEFAPDAMSEEERMGWLKAVFRHKSAEFLAENVKQFRGSAGFMKMAAREIKEAMAEEKARIKIWPEIKRRTVYVGTCLREHDSGKIDREELCDRIAKNDYLQLSQMHPEEQKLFEDGLRAMEWPEGLSRQELIVRAGRDPDKFEAVTWNHRPRIIPLWRETGYGIHGLTPEEEVERLRQLAERGRSVPGPDGSVMAPQDYLAFLAAAGSAAVGMTADAFQSFMTEWNPIGASAAPTEKSGPR